MTDEEKHAHVEQLAAKMRRHAPNSPFCPMCGVQYGVFRNRQVPLEQPFCENCCAKMGIDVGKHIFPRAVVIGFAIFVAAAFVAVAVFGIMRALR